MEAEHSINKEEVIALFKYHHKLIVLEPKNLETYEAYVEAVRELRSSSIRTLRHQGIPGRVRAYMNDELERISHPNHRAYLFYKDPTCKICFYEIVTLREATVDHIIPTSKGGPNILSNKQIAHGPCNVRKSDKIVTKKNVQEL